MRIAVDASALAAILLDEPDAGVYVAKLLSASKAWISPVNWCEVQVLMRSRHGEAGEAKATALIESFGIDVEPVTLQHAKLAAAASARYRGRPARLNLGDCFAYALASAKNVPLLFKGNDFKNTDVVAA